MLKYGGEVLAVLLTQIVNLMFISGHTPAALVHSRVRLIDKKGSKPKTDPRAHRPVAISSIIGKVYELVLARRLSHILESHPESMLSTFQFGFRGNHGCDDFHFALSETIKERARQNKRTWVVSVDIANAFGSIRHSTIICALRARGISGLLLIALTSMLEGTNFIHCPTSPAAERVTSERLKFGVRQGSVLSPLLWGIGYDNILRGLNATDLGVQLATDNRRMSAVAYADDSYLIAGSHENAQKLVHKLGQLAIGMDAFAPDLHFKHSDSTLVIFGKLGTDEWNAPLVLGGRPDANGNVTGELPIPESTTTKIVGLTYSQTLGERRGLSWLDKDGNLVPESKRRHHPMGPEPRTQIGGIYPCSTEDPSHPDRDLLGQSFTSRDGEIQFTLAEIYFDTELSRTMATLRAKRKRHRSPYRIHIPLEEAYYKLTKSVRTDPWLPHITLKINQTARLAQWQLSKSNFGGTNGVWRNQLDSLLLLEQLAFPGALYGSPITQPGHKRKGMLRSTKLLSNMIARVRAKITATTFPSGNHEAWCSEFGRLSPTDLLDMRSLRFMHRLLILPPHTYTHRILTQQLQRNTLDTNKTNYPVHLMSSSRVLRELDDKHGTHIIATFAQEWTPGHSHKQHLIAVSKRFREKVGDVHSNLQTVNPAARLYTLPGRIEFDRLRHLYARWLRTSMLSKQAAAWHQHLAARGYGEAATVDRSSGPQFCFSSGSHSSPAQWLTTASRHKLNPTISRGITFRLRLRVGACPELPSHAGKLQPASDITRFSCRCCNSDSTGSFSHLFVCSGLQHLVDGLRNDINRIATQDAPNADDATPYSGEAIAHLIEDANNLQALVMARGKYALTKALSRPNAILRNKSLPAPTYKRFDEAICLFFGRTAFELARKERIYKTEQQQQGPPSHPPSQLPPPVTPKRPASQQDRIAQDNDARNKRRRTRERSQQEAHTPATHPNFQPTPSLRTQSRLDAYLATQQAFDSQLRQDNNTSTAAVKRGSGGGGGGAVGVRTRSRTDRESREFVFSGD